jgi:hypothetical protein
MIRYEITTEKEGSAHEIRGLSNAFIRSLGARPAELRAVEVCERAGHLHVVMDLEGSEDQATRWAEDAFSDAWYDAFGVHGAPHRGSAAQVPGAPGEEPGGGEAGTGRSG